MIIYFNLPTKKKQQIFCQFDLKMYIYFLDLYFQVKHIYIIEREKKNLRNTKKQKIKNSRLLVKKQNGVILYAYSYLSNNYMILLSK